ncbi:hypothetical protein O7627_28900 [Solwaraspora sp. WMMD1047]|nr:hypothetical protein [Solwaraspora sp. WMMD1047]MDG4833295.1 hypothetical protein [Solwaraspora sp. WMMD1047]
MSPFFAVFLVLLLGSSSYAAGRLHGQLSYRIGYRFGYRQGYFDGDRGAWHRRRRDGQLAMAAMLADPPAGAGSTDGGPSGPVLAGGGRVPVSAELPPGGPGEPPPGVGEPAGLFSAGGQGTTYTGASFAGAATNGGRHSTDVLTGGNA